jgi:predicted AlkP superfamily phosphohydrolase/phosphomutase
LNSKVLVLGIDGLDPVILKAMMDDGKMPNFSKLANMGTFSPLTTSNPPQSPVAWTCMASGNNPGKNGVFDFIVRNSKTYLPELGLYRIKGGIAGSNYERTFKGEPFWKYLTGAGIPSTVVKWPMTFPVDDSASRLLGGLGVPDIKGGLGDYAFYTDKGLSRDEEGREKVVFLKFVGAEAKTVISGPLISGLTGKKPATIPFIIKTERGAKKAQLSIGDQNYQIYEGIWSPWIKVKFSIDLFRKVHGMCRFYLRENGSNFGLYMTPIHINPEEATPPISYPIEYSSELARNIGPYSTLGIPEDTKALTENRINEEAFIEMCNDIITKQEEIFWYEFERFKQGLFASVFFTTDRIQHVFWSTRDPGHPIYSKKYAKEYGNVIPDFYRRMDKILGKILKSMNDRTLLIVCSDHGFTTFRKGVNLNSWLVENGFMHLKQEPEPDDARGGPLFKYVDWKKTKAYALGLGSIYINLQGRESNGIVSKERYQEVLNSLTEKLSSFRDHENGTRVIKAIYSSREMYSGLDIDQAPDLVIGFNTGYRMSWQTAIGGTPAKVLNVNENKWSGDHCVDPSLVPGSLLMNRKIKTGSPTIYDIAPTILQHYGLKVDTDGKSLL